MAVPSLRPNVNSVDMCWIYFNDLGQTAWTIFLRDKLISSVCSCEVLENLLLSISNESFRMAQGEEEETWSCRQRNNLAMSFYENVGCPQHARNCQVSEQLWIPKIEVLVLAKRAFINSSASAM